MSNRHSTLNTSRLARGPWGSAAFIGARFCRIRLKNPLGGLMVNTIAYHEPGVLLVIDPGWPWTLDALEQALRDTDLIRSSLSEVTHWLYTHTHVDHMGSAALLAARSNATHHYLEAIAPQAPHWHHFQDQMSDWDNWMVESVGGASRQLVREKVAQRARRPTMIEAYGDLPLRHSETFALGDRVRFGSLELEVHDARGHDPYHVAFYEPQLGLLISGDAVMNIPTPITRVMGDELSPYEETLERLERLQAEALIPGHGTQVLGSEQVKRLIQGSRAHVARYRGQLRAFFATQQEPIELWSLGVALRPDDTILQRGHETRWWSHLGLLQSHLDLLIARGEVGIEQGEEGPHYVRR